ncbi:MAG TPA: metalloprotease PmbA [Gammaproteobacteria bacterium]|nr:metalloprotease PmbA [Gammaproteobacteria bacterium]
MSSGSSPLKPKTNDQFDSAQLSQIVDDMLAEARRLGASAAEAGVSIEAGLSVNVRLGEVETIEHNRDKGLGITVYFGQRKGSASTSDFSSVAIQESVKAACDIARYTEADEYAGLADKSQMATDIPDLDLYHHWDLNAEQAIEIAKECEDAARSFDARISNSEGASVSSHDGFRVYGNSHGFMGMYPSSRHSLSVAVIGEQDNNMQRDSWYTVSRQPEELLAADEVGKLAAQHTVARLGAKKISTCQLPVLFDAEVARGLLGHFVRAINGSAQYRKSTFLLDHLGKAVFPSRIRIDERPHLIAGLGSAPFDSEGVATHDRDLLASGELQSYVLDSYSARRLGMQSTGNAGGTHNVFISQDDLDQTQLLKKMDRGILVTEVMGQGVNIVTGDYSRGASGYWVENGEIQYPIEEFTLASRLQDMYMNLVAVGNDLDTRGNLCTGSWLIEQMTVAGE